MDLLSVNLDEIITCIMLHFVSYESHISTSTLLEKYAAAVCNRLQYQLSSSTVDHELFKPATTHIYTHKWQQMRKVDSWPRVTGHWQVSQRLTGPSSSSPSSPFSTNPTIFIRTVIKCRCAVIKKPGHEVIKNLNERNIKEVIKTSTWQLLILIIAYLLFQNIFVLWFSVLSIKYRIVFIKSLWEPRNPWTHFVSLRCGWRLSARVP